MRDDLDARTPKVAWGIFGFNNATIPSGHKIGLQSYLDNYVPEMNVNSTYHNNVFNSITNNNIIDKLDNDIPVILTLEYYYMRNHNGDIVNIGSSEKGSWHVVVAYGYRYVNGNLQYLCHMGWGNGGTTRTAMWLSPTDGIEAFIYGYCYIDAPLSIFKATEFTDQSLRIDSLR